MLLFHAVGSLSPGFWRTVEINEHGYSLGVVGFGGGFTTFSLFSWGLLRMMRTRTGHHSGTTFYIGLCLLFVVVTVTVTLGFYLGTKINIVK